MIVVITMVINLRRVTAIHTLDGPIKSRKNAACNSLRDRIFSLGADCHACLFCCALTRKTEDGVLKHSLLAPTART